MYRFEYELNVEDYQEFNLFICYGIPQNKARITKNQWAGPLIYGVCAIALALFTKNYSISFIWFGTASLLWVLTYHRRIRRNISKNIKRMEKVGKMPCEGHHTAIFDETSFTSKDKYEEVHSDYAAIDKIGIGKSAFYLFNSAASAYIIPYCAFANEEEKSAFFQFIQSKAPAAAVLEAAK